MENLLPAPDFAQVKFGHRGKVPQYSSDFLFYSSNGLFLRRDFSSKLKNLPMRCTTLGRILYSKLLHFGLDDAEIKIFEEISKRLKGHPSKSKSLAFQLVNLLIKQIVPHESLLKLIRRSPSNQREFLQRLIFHGQSISLMFDSLMRNLPRWSHLKEKFLLLEKPPRRKKIKAKRLMRKRGYSDHGTLPRDPIFSKANREGGERIFQKEQDSNFKVVKFGSKAENSDFLKVKIFNLKEESPPEFKTGKFNFFTRLESTLKDRKSVV